MSLTAAAVAVMISSAAPQAGPPSPVEPVETAVAVTPPEAALPVDAPVSDAAAPDQTQEADGAADDAGPGSEITVSHRRRMEGDPLENLNVQSFKTVQAVDSAVLEPVAKAYNKGLPRPVRTGLRNFFSNLNEPVVFVAYLLELKPGKAVETVGRFAINSTIGIGGLVDVAKKKPFNLPYRPNGLANVLGYYGVGPGPYMYLPIIGPTTLRDLAGDTVDKMLLPVAVGDPFNRPAVVIPSTILSQLGERAAFDEEARRIKASDDPYATYRALYLQQRKAEIDALHGRVSGDVVPVYGRTMPTAGARKEAAPADPAPAETPVEQAPQPQDQ